MARKPKAYEAKVKDSYRIPSVTALGGWEFTKHDWRLVPEGQADAAEAHPHLDVREVSDEGDEGDETAAIETEAKAADEPQAAEDIPPRFQAGKEKAEEANVPKNGRPAIKRRSGGK